MSLSGITLSGLSSGIDTDGLIQRLLQVEAIPIRRLKLQEAQLNNRSSVLQQLRGQMSTLSTNAAGLSNAAAFNPISALSSDPAVATIAGTSNASVGTYQVAVTALAQANKVSSAPQTDTTAALGHVGKLLVNGVGVDVAASDSLSAIAQKITNANAGVTASVIDGGSGNAYLTMTASFTGASSKVQVADLTGTVAQSLGVVSGASAIREAITNGATSQGFSSSSATIASLTGVSGLPAGVATINGIGVSINFDTDSLQAIADKINLAGTGATASVRSATVNGKTVYKLDIAGAGTPTFSETNGALSGIGILQQPFGSQLVAAQSAQYKLDTINFTSETNTITTVIPGATLTLLSGDITTPKTTKITMSKDSEAIKSTVQGFVDSFNGVVGFIKANSSFDKDTFASGALFGDPVARQAESQITDLLFNNVPGLNGTYKNLSQLGFALAEDGTLSFDQAKFDTALAADPEGVSAVFRSVGTGSNNTISYVSSGNKTRASGTSAYTVNITQVARVGAYTGSVAQTLASTTSETLTFDGGLLGTTPYQLVLPTGSTAAATVTRINSDSRLKDLVVASLSGGMLMITGKKFGTSNAFTVDSTMIAANDNSGIGIGQPGTTVAALDVAGTLNGEAATGNGQFLAGNTGNTNTEGLQIQYTGLTTGVVGTIKFTKGIGAQMTDSVFSFTDNVSGLLSSTDTAIQEQVKAIQDSIKTIEDRLTSRQQELRMRFAAMEQAITQAQAQGARLAALSR